MTIGGKLQVEDIYVRGTELDDIRDPGTGVAIDVSRSGHIQVVTAAAETNTLAAPTFVGQRLIISCKTRAVGDRVITVSASFNASGNTTITLDTAGDAICLEASRGSAGVLKWNQAWTNGPTLG
jgi:hypothetical protein